MVTNECGYLSKVNIFDKYGGKDTPGSMAVNTRLPTHALNIFTGINTFDCFLIFASEALSSHTFYSIAIIILGINGRLVCDVK